MGQSAGSCSGRLASWLPDSRERSTGAHCSYRFCVVWRMRNSTLDTVYTAPNTTLRVYKQRLPATKQTPIALLGSRAT